MNYTDLAALTCYTWCEPMGLDAGLDDCPPGTMPELLRISRAAYGWHR